jgi:tetratricopeptide (TPR) repeat protein
LRRKRAGWNILISVLLAAMAVRPGPLSAGLAPLPPGIDTLYNAGQYRQAAEALQEAVERNPKDAALYYWLGRCYFEIRDFDHSISNWERTVVLESGRPEYHDWLGRAYNRKADENSHSNMASAFSLARRTHDEFQTAVRLDATNVNAQRDLIAFMANAPANLGGGEKHALEQIRALSTVDPVEGELALADLYAVKKKFEQASEEYWKVLKSAPDRVDVDFEVADYYRDRGDSEHVERAVEAAAKIDSSDRRLNYYRGVALVLQKKDADVVRRIFALTSTPYPTIPNFRRTPLPTSGSESSMKTKINRTWPPSSIRLRWRSTQRAKRYTRL